MLNWCFRASDITTTEWEWGESLKSNADCPNTVEFDLGDLQSRQTRYARVLWKCETENRIVGFLAKFTLLNLCEENLNISSAGTSSWLLAFLCSTVNVVSFMIFCTFYLLYWLYLILCCKSHHLKLASTVLTKDKLNMVTRCIKVALRR